MWGSGTVVTHSRCGSDGPFRRRTRSSGQVDLLPRTWFLGVNDAATLASLPSSSLPPPPLYHLLLPPPRPPPSPLPLLSAVASLLSAPFCSFFSLRDSIRERWSVVRLVLPLRVRRVHVCTCCSRVRTCTSKRKKDGRTRGRARANFQCVRRTERRYARQQRGDVVTREWKREQREKQAVSVVYRIDRKDDDERVGGRVHHLVRGCSLSGTLTLCTSASARSRSRTEFY